MTSFAEYPRVHPTMSAQDFELYSSHETFPEMMATSHPYLPTSTGFSDTYAAPMSTMEQTQAMNAFAYQFDLDQSNPPHLSTSSESGASVQSTTSSSRGSPHMNAEYQEPWTQMHHGLGLTSGPMLKDFGHDSFVTSGVEFDPILSADKLPAGCVGESSRHHVSSSEPDAASAFSSSSHLSFPTYGEHVARRNTTPAGPAEGRSGVGAAAEAARHVPGIDTAVFKSPAAPASATLFSAASRKRRLSSVFSADARRQRSESAASDASLASSAEAASQFEPSPFSPSFSFPSSSSHGGPFYYPLDSSCWLPCDPVELLRAGFSSCQTVLMACGWNRR
jgi:hypothetical protein